jgi:glycosyltransferase involved in cell wall biosynthesis
VDFVVIANAWQAGTANPTSKHRIALELARRGHRVLWLEGAGMRAPSLGSGHDRSRIRHKLWRAFQGAVPIVQPPEADGLPVWVLSPLLVPLPRLGSVRRLNGWTCASSARRWSRRLDFADPILINYVPVLAEAMRAWRESRSGTPEASAAGSFPESKQTRVVYYCVDRWDAFGMYDSAVMAKTDEECCRHADLVIASSANLAERCRRFNPSVHHVSHGVDHAHFAQALRPQPRPADLPQGRIIGFFGLLSEWIDQELLHRTAAEIPDTELVLIGSADVPIERLRGRSNIHLLGPRPFAELPRYVAHFDVGIVPFRVNDLTRAVNPIKLREMLAAGCPVVSTALPEVAALAAGLGRLGQGGVRIGTSVGDFIASVREELQRGMTVEERQRISASMAGETWEAKVNRILELLSSSAQSQHVKPVG